MTRWPDNEKELLRELWWLGAVLRWMINLADETLREIDETSSTPLR